MWRIGVLYQYTVGGVHSPFVNYIFFRGYIKDTISTQKQHKLICGSNQVVEFYRHSSLSVVLINPVPRACQRPFSMLCCPEAVRGSEVDLCRVPAEICARFGLTKTPFYIPNCQFWSRCWCQKETTCWESVINLTVSLSVFIHPRAALEKQQRCSHPIPFIILVKAFQFCDCCCRW